MHRRWPAGVGRVWWDRGAAQAFRFQLSAWTGSGVLCRSLSLPGPPGGPCVRRRRRPLDGRPSVGVRERV